MSGRDRNSAISSEQQSEYSQSYGTTAAPSLDEDHIMQQNRIQKRSDSQMLPRLPPYDEIEDGNKCHQQTWSSTDRAHHSDVFEPETLGGKEEGELKSARKWPWQDRQAISHIFDGNNYYVDKQTEIAHKPGGPECTSECRKSGNTNKLMWPWQARAMTSDIFKYTDAAKQLWHKDYAWHQGKTTLNHKVDDVIPDPAGPMQKYLGPRHDYSYQLKRRDYTPPESQSPGSAGEVGDYDIISEITKMSLDDAEDYMKGTEMNLEEEPHDHPEPYG